MKLKSLLVSGFKSFPEARLDFPQGITAVVGPNGVGKSNIVDAILWVLGEQSTKTLRSERMEDVIFNGTESRKPLAWEVRGRRRRDESRTRACSRRAGGIAGQQRVNGHSPVVP